MPVIRRLAMVAALALVVLVLAPTARPTAAAGSVALTFDDLPSHGPLPPGVSRLDVADRIIEALRRGGVPAVYGFINARAIEREPGDAAVLDRWRAAGFPLGNHAFSHMDLHANTAEAFGQDVVANEATLRRLMGETGWQWFRFPYLREGDTSEKHRAVRALLAERGYRVAQVTVSFHDYAYNEPYVRCLATGDTRGVEILERSYLDGADASLTRARETARALVGRDISHVMLLHIGVFQTVMLPKLLDLLKTRDITLTTLDAAQQDTIYAATADGLSAWNGTWLDQLSAARSLPPTPAANSPFKLLGEICR